MAIIKYYLIVENHEDGKLLELKSKSNNDGYIVFNRFCIEKNISKPLFRKLLKRGLYMSIDARENVENLDNLFSLQRLASCIADDISSKEVHHINKSVKNNSILNLLPMAKAEHTLLDNDCDYIAKGNKLFNEYFKQRVNNTICTNNSIIWNFLECKIQGKSVKQLKRKFKNISKSKLYEIQSYFYYLEDYIKWLKMLKDKPSPRLSGILSECWKDIEKFDEIRYGWNEEFTASLESFISVKVDFNIRDMNMPENINSH